MNPKNNMLITFKNMQSFRRRVAKTTAWADYFKLAGRRYEIYEYGGGWRKGEPCFVYFLNKRTKNMIRVEYHLPSVNYRDGVRVEEGEYRLIDTEFIEGAYLWR